MTAPAAPAETLRRAAEVLRESCSPGVPDLTDEYPDLDAAIASLLEAQAWIAEHEPEAFDTQTGRRALAVARALLGEDGA